MTIVAVIDKDYFVILGYQERLSTTGLKLIWTLERNRVSGDISFSMISFSFDSPFGLICLRQKVNSGLWLLLSGVKELHSKAAETLPYSNSDQCKNL